MLRNVMLAAAALVMLGGQASAQGTLGGDLTPFGAVKAGNADGSIPAWDGGITKPPAGFTPGMHHPDPYSGDKPLFTIDKSNYQQYKDNLTAGQVALFETYGDSYKMTVYPTRRSASAPDFVYEETIKNATRAKLDDGGNGVVGAQVGIPFPKPTEGVQAVWNHTMRWRGFGAATTFSQVSPTAGGAFTPVLYDTKFYFRYADRDRPADENFVIYFLQEVKEPTRLAGTILLVHETINQVKQPRAAWAYNPGQRRVRRAPDIAYDNPGTAADGQRTSDDYDMYNGAPDRYEWTLVGKKEMYVPYNAYKMHSDQTKYVDMVKPKHLNPDLMRFEKHRVWIVDGKLRSDKRHIYDRRTFYIDEDSWQIVAMEMYDGRGQIWRVGESHGINYYDVPTYWSTVDAIYDLQNGRYTAVGLDNENQMYDFTAKLSKDDFNPDALRTEGLR